MAMYAKQSEFSKFVNLSQKIGRMIPFWTQGAGGNTSCKQDNALSIKASGVLLHQMTEQAGFVDVNLDLLRNGLKKIYQIQDNDLAEKQYAQLLTEVKLDSSTPGRPSMEAGFHAVLEKKFVLHFHSLASVLLFHDWKVNAEVVQNFISKYYSLNQVHFVDFCLPGWELTRAVFGHEDADILFLENHGVVVCGDDQSCLQKFIDFEIAFCESFGYAQLAASLRFAHQSIEGKGSVDHEIQPGSEIGQLKIYFPDAAIVFNQLIENLKPSEDTSGQVSVLSGNASQMVKEIWSATQMLYQANPNLESLDQSWIALINNIPTEKLRIKAMGKL